MGAFCGFLIYFIHRKNIKASQTPTVNNDCIQTVSLELDNVMSVKM